MHVWEKLKDFLTKAGTVLLGASVVVWALQYFDFSFHHVQDSSQSILGVIGTAIAPVFQPLGFGDWRSSVSLLSGLIAREQVVSSLGILYGASGAGLTAALQAVYSPAGAYAFMTFALLFIPCIAAVTTIRREMNSGKWTVFCLGFSSGGRLSGHVCGVSAWPAVDAGIFKNGEGVFRLGWIADVLIAVLAACAVGVMLYQKMCARHVERAAAAVLSLAI